MKHVPLDNSAVISDNGCIKYIYEEKINELEIIQRFIRLI